MQIHVLLVVSENTATDHVVKLTNTVNVKFRHIKAVNQSQTFKLR